jgi:hypothetical protein
VDGDLQRLIADNEVRARREYEDVRADPRRFVVVPGHERSELETVIRAERDYVVVQKREEAGVRAEKTDPRG